MIALSRKEKKLFQNNPFSVKELNSLLLTDGGARVYESFGLIVASNKAQRSPLREDKKPSFSLFRAKDGLWWFKDFGTGKAGSPLQFFIQATGQDYKSAIETLSRLYGVGEGRPKPLTPKDTTNKLFSPLFEQALSNKTSLHKISYSLVDETLWLEKLNKSQGTFQGYCKKCLGISEQHLKRWGIGQDEKGFTLFPLRNRVGDLVNIKFIRYSISGNRDKKTMPHYLQKSENQQYGQCLFGEHLLRDGHPVVLVESEKTAVIGSFFYPQYDWLATGGSSALGDKLLSLKGKSGMVLVDADDAGRNTTIAKKLQQFQIPDFKILDLFPERNDGYDLADAIKDGLKPDLSLAKEIIEYSPKSKSIRFNYTKLWKADKYITEVGQNLAKTLQKESRAVLQADPGSGKTYWAVNQLLPLYKGKSLFVVPLLSIANQVSELYGLPVISGQADIEDIQSAMSYNSAVCTYDSLYKVADYYNHFVMDEAHVLNVQYDIKRASAGLISKLLRDENKHFLFLTATPDPLWTSLGFSFFKVDTKKNPVPLNYSLSTENTLQTCLNELKNNPLQSDTLTILQCNSVETLLTVEEYVLKSGTQKQNVKLWYRDCPTLENDPDWQMLQKEGRVGESVQLILCTSIINEGINIYTEKKCRMVLVMGKGNPDGYYPHWQPIPQFFARVRESAQLNCFLYLPKSDKAKERKPFDLSEEFKMNLNLWEMLCKKMNLGELDNNAIQGLKLLTGFDDYQWLTTYSQEEGGYIPHLFAIINHVTRKWKITLDTEDLLHLLSSLYPYLRIQKLQYQTNEKEIVWQEKQTQRRKSTEKAVMNWLEEEPLLFLSALYAKTRNKSLKEQLTKSFPEYIFTQKLTENQEQRIKEKDDFSLFSKHIKKSEEATQRICALKFTGMDIPEINKIVFSSDGSFTNQDLFRRQKDAFRAQYLHHCFLHQPTKLTKPETEDAKWRESFLKTIVEGNEYTPMALTNLVNKARERFGLLGDWKRDRCLELVNALCQVETKTKNRWKRYIITEKGTIDPRINLKNHLLSP